MWKQFRPVEEGEFFLVSGDCSQGGDDYNAAHCISKTKMDVPLVYHAQGVAAQMTPELHRVCERLSDVTGVRPVVGLERQMGGASEMERLRVLNRNSKYSLFVMPVIGQTEEKDTNKLGWDTSSMTRPILVGDLKNTVDVHGITIYDETTIQELFWFVINKQGKPEAMKGKNDDLVMSLGVGVQMYQNCIQPFSSFGNSTPKSKKNWSIG